VAAALVAATAVTAAVRAYTITTPPRPDTNIFVRRSQLGMGERSLNQLTNAEIRRDLDRAGMVVRRTVIYSTRITATPAPSSRRSATDPAGGPAINTEELTILLHRSVWSVGQVTRGAPEQDTN